ncbi:IS21 family transposase [Salmonella enterica]|nr:IS21 family transposase [Salmonella enterica]EMD4080865.1 IS21 family transposase [Salmonella enterica]EMD4605996.1 IS21 family transposase [Salmonella enterica]EMD4629422.1 IS21 family transposase [Salmonella enterica]EMD4692052.1 IS21 family transposase [Salmonella enterica]
MLTLELRVEIAVLRRQGMSIRAIARHLRCSRQTIRRYIRMGDAASSSRYSTRAPRPGKLDPFKAYINERVEAARPHWIPASVMLQEIRARGYSGGYSMLTAYLFPLKQQPAEPVVRFETEPGEQMQVDFTIIRQGSSPLLAIVATLGWSRATYVRFYANQDTAAWCDGIEHALAFFGGTPRHLLFDNAKAIILERDVYGEGLHRWNPTLLALAEKYGFTPRVCRPYRAKTKGKVERFNRDLKESFVIPLATTFKQSGLLLDVDSANARVGAWLVHTANARKHGTTGVPPDQRLQKELAALLPLPVPGLFSVPRLADAPRRALPVESIQHPLSVYQSLLEERS